jgi:predicted dienelactone hydrolase
MPFLLRTLISIRVLLACSLAIPCALLSPALLAQDVAGVGIAAIKVADPVNGGSMPGFVFYPSAQASSMATAIGPYAVDAAFGAPALPGAKPLVVISHGHGGSDLGHHDLATYLARHGFIVATFEHPKDNFHDVSGTANATVLAGRAVQVRATISTLLADPRWKKQIDPTRIGVAGFSAGGYTSLLVVGAQPRFDRFIGYCQRHPDDADTCSLVKKLSPKATADHLAAVQNDMHRWGPTDDPRVKAAFVMAPLSLVFDKAGAAAIDRPVDLWYGQHDHVLLPADNAAHLAPLVRTLTRVTVVPNADHWVFLAPCSPELAKEAKTICSDPPGVDRVKVHARLNADALAFFRQTLAVPAH